VGRGRGVGVGLGIGVAVAQGLTGQWKISMSPAGVAGSYPPASQMLSVPSVSVGKLRRALTNDRPVDQLLVLGS
jgi:hypothetical protein